MGLGSIITKLGGRGAAKGASKGARKGASKTATKGAKRGRKSKRESFVEEFGEGFGGFARAFMTNLTGVDFSLSDSIPSLGLTGAAMSPRSGMNTGRPAPQFQVVSKTAKRYSNPSLQVISNQVSDIIDSLSAVNGQLRNQLDMTRFSYNESIKVDRENILEAKRGEGAGALLAANDNSPTSTLGTNALINAMTSVADQLKDLTTQLRDMDLNSIAQCCGGDSDIDIYGGAPDDVDTGRKPTKGTKGKSLRKLRVKAKMLRRAAGRALPKILKAGRGGLAGLTIGLGADFAADYLGRNTRGGAVADVVSKTATYAGIGAMVGSFIPGLGTLVGGALGGVVGMASSVYDNADALFRPAGVGSTGDAKKAMDFFTSRGWQAHQAAGIVGNLQVESGANLNPNAMRENDAGPGLHSYGIAQWNRERFAGLQAYAKSKGKPWNDFDTQLEYVDTELRGYKLNAGRALMNARTAEDAAVIVDKMYEVSSGAARGQRISNAVKLLEQYKTPANDPNEFVKQAPKGAPSLLGRNPQTGAPSMLLDPKKRDAMAKSDAGTGWGGAPFAPGKGPQNAGWGGAPFKPGENAPGAVPLNEFQKKGVEHGVKARQAAAMNKPTGPVEMPSFAVAKGSGLTAEQLKAQYERTGTSIISKSVQNAAKADEPEVRVIQQGGNTQVPMKNGSTLPSSLVGTDGVPDPTFPELYDIDSPTCRTFYHPSYMKHRAALGGLA